MEKVYLFTDYRGQFYSSTKYRGAAVDLKQKVFRLALGLARPREF